VDRGVAAQQSMLAKEPQVARLDVDRGRLGDRRDVVGIAQDRSMNAVLLGQFGEHLRERRIAGLDVSRSAARASLSAVAIAASGSRLASTSRSSSSLSST
jgi:hypothetical protein